MMDLETDRFQVRADNGDEYTVIEYTAYDKYRANVAGSTPVAKGKRLVTARAGWNVSVSGPGEYEIVAGDGSVIRARRI
jgi:hypothetical protein